MFKSYFKPERRYARRLARQARWDRPIAGTWSRFSAWSHMLLADHGIFRVIYLNCHKVTESFWRAAQPAPHQIDKLARAGLKTIVTLRGGREFGSWPLEREACERNGIVLQELVMRSREAPDAASIIAARDLFQNMQYPALIHCKSGADRAGFVSALFLILHEKRTATEALKALSSRYGHFRWSKTGILDSFIETYRDEGEARGMGLIDWVQTAYDPEKLKSDFKPNFWSNMLVDRVLHRE